jgi:hypothetical protein
MSVLRSMPMFLALAIALWPITVYAGGEEPPTDAEKQIGPAIVGTITLTGTTAQFVGTCKGKDVLLGPVPLVLDLSQFQESQLVNRRITDAGPAGCLSAAGGEDLIINTITKFMRFDGTLVSADVVLLFVVPRKTKT